MLGMLNKSAIKLSQNIHKKLSNNKKNNPLHSNFYYLYKKDFCEIQ